MQFFACPLLSEVKLLADKIYFLIDKFPYTINGALNNCQNVQKVYLLKAFDKLHVDFYNLVIYGKLKYIDTVFLKNGKECQFGMMIKKKKMTQFHV